MYHQQINNALGFTKICVCSKHCVQKSNNVAWRKRVGKGYGQVQKLLWYSIIPQNYWHHKNTCPKTSNNWLLFFQVQRLQHVTTNCSWLPQENSRHFCGNAWLNEWCTNLLNLQLVLESYICMVICSSKIKVKNTFDLIYLATNITPCCHGWWFFTNMLETCTIPFSKAYSTDIWVDVNVL